MTRKSSQHAVLTRGKACLICRGKKHKCDAVKPSCGPCIRSGMAGKCIYNTAPVKSALRKLEDKARELEELVERLNGRNSITASSDASSPDFSTGPPTPPTAPYIGWVTGPIILPSESMSFEPLSPSFIDYPRVPSPFEKTPKSLIDPFTMMMRQEQLPSHIQSHLVNIFLAHRWHYATDFNVPRFLAAAELPQSNLGCSVHPALIDAMCLLGCMHSQGAFQKYEDLFLQRIVKSLDDALLNADRLFDFLRASALLGCYYYVKARGVEAHSRLGATIRFAMACGLHEINPDLNSQQKNSVLCPPRDLIELGDRIYLFWSLFCIDRSGSLITGLPSAFPNDDEKIKTPWPCPLEYYIDGQALHVQQKTLASLRQDPPEACDPNDPFDNVQTFFSKCLHFLHRAATLAEQSKKEDHAEEIIITGKSLSRLCDSLTNYQKRHGLYGGNTAHDGVLVLAITATHAAWIQLLNINANRDEGAWQHRLTVARASMAIVREAIAADPACLHLLLGLTWTPVYEVLAEELFRFTELGDTVGAAFVQNELDELMDALRLLHFVFPFKMDMHVEHLKKLGIHSMAIRL